MRSFQDYMRHWQAVSAETETLLRRNDELMVQRAELMRAAAREFRTVTHLAHEIVARAGGAGRRSR